MDIRLDHEIELPGRLRGTAVAALSFHPLRRTVAIALSNQILEYDLLNGAIVSMLAAPARVTHLMHSLSHHYLIAAMEDGSLQAWDLDMSAPIGRFVPSRKDERKEVNCMVVSRLRPQVFYARVGGHTVTVVDFSPGSVNKQTFRLDDGKTAITSLACHPFKPILATGNERGAIRIWEYETHQLRYICDEYSVPTKKNQRAAIASMVFHPYKDILVVGTALGRIACWDVQGLSNGILIGSRATSDADWAPISCVSFHPHAQVFFSLSARGDLRAWRLAPTGRVEDRIKLSGFVRPSTVTESELRARQAHSLQPGSLELSAITAQQMHVHGRFNYITFMFGITPGATRTVVPTRHVIYSLVDGMDPQSHLAVIEAQRLSAAFFGRSGDVSMFPAETYYVDRAKIMSYNLTRSENWSVQKLPPESSMRAVRLRHALKQKRFLVVLESFESFAELPGALSRMADYTDPRRELERMMDDREFMLLAMDEVQTSLDQPKPLRDAVFLGSQTEQTSYLALSKNGGCAYLFATLDQGEQAMFTLERSVHRVFWTPLARAHAVLYYAPLERELFYSANYTAGDPGATLPPPGYGVPFYDFMPAPRDGPRLELLPGELLIDVVWAEAAPGQSLAAVVTGQRLLVVDERLQLIASYTAPAREQPPYFYSALWLGPCLVFSTAKSIECMTLDSAVRPLCAIDLADAVLAGVLHDRLLYAHRIRKRVSIRHHAIGLLEALVAGYLALPQALYPSFALTDLKATLALLAARYDAQRVSSGLLELLQARGFPDLAHALAKVSTYVDPALRAQSALASHDFDGAVSFLERTKQEMLSGATAERMRSLDATILATGHRCVEAGQLLLAERCFREASAPWALLLLYITAGHVPGVESLLSGARDDVALKQACGEYARLQKEAGRKSGKGLVNWPFKSSISFTRWATATTTRGEMRALPGDGGPDTPIEPLELDSWGVWIAAVNAGGAETEMGLSPSELGSNVDRGSLHAGHEGGMRDRDRGGGVSDGDFNTSRAKNNGFGDRSEEGEEPTAGGAEPDGLERDADGYIIRKEGPPAIGGSDDATPTATGGGSNSDDSEEERERERKKRLRIVIKTRTEDEMRKEREGQASGTVTPLSLGGPVLASRPRTTSISGPAPPAAGVSRLRGGTVGRRPTPTDAAAGLNSSAASDALSPTSVGSGFTGSGFTGSAGGNTPPPGLNTSSAGLNTSQATVVQNPLEQSAASLTLPPPSSTARSGDRSGSSRDRSGDKSDSDSGWSTDEGKPRDGKKKRTSASDTSASASAGPVGESAVQSTVPSTIGSPMEVRTGTAPADAARPAPTWTSFDEKPSFPAPVVAKTTPTAAAQMVPQSPKAAASGAGTPSTPRRGRRFSLPDGFRPPSPTGSVSSASTSVDPSDAAKCLRSGMRRLECGDFQGATDDVNLAVDALLNSSAGTEQVRAQIIMCVNYLVALRILLQIKKMDKNPSLEAKQDISLLTRLLADVPIHAKHRIVTIQMAIHKAMAVQNYGTAGRLIAMLTGGKALPEKDKAAFDAQMAVCKEHRGADAAMPSHACPLCQTVINPGFGTCKACKAKIRFCAVSLEVLTVYPFNQCAYCGTSYSPTVCKVGDWCSYCKFGALESVSK